MLTVAELEQKVDAAHANARSPITREATCAVFRDVLIPMLEAEIRATGIFGFAARWAIGKVKDVLQAYVDRTCGALRGVV